MDKKISFFVTRLAGGGAERVILNLAGGFRERGFSVDLILKQRTGEYLSQVPSGVNLVDLEGSSWLVTLLRLKKYMETEKPYFLLSTIPECNFIALAAFRLASFKPQLAVRESGFPGLRKGRDGYLARLICRAAPYCYSLATRTVSCSEAVKNALRDNYGLPENKLVTIPNPLDIDKIQRLAAKDQPPVNKQEGPLFLGVGRLGEEKRFSLILRAFSNFLNKRSARLIILGEGRKREHLEQLAEELGISDRVQFSGFVSNPYAYMSRADLFLLSSAYEGLPNVVLEALAVGLPVVATDSPGGTGEILAGGEYGELVASDDPGDFAAAISRALGSAPPPEKVRARAAEYAIDRVVDRYIEVFEL